MLKLMELSMAAGLSFKWNAQFGHLDYLWYHVNMVASNKYEVRHKNNDVAAFKSSPDEVVDYLTGGLT